MASKLWGVDAEPALRSYLQQGLETWNLFFLDRYPSLLFKLVRGGPPVRLACGCPMGRTAFIAQV